MAGRKASRAAAAAAGGSVKEPSAAAPKPKTVSTQSAQAVVPPKAGASAETAPVRHVQHCSVHGTPVDECADRHGGRRLTH